jgi:hypothetical protein
MAITFFVTFPFMKAEGRKLSKSNILSVMKAARRYIMHVYDEAGASAANHHEST